MSPAQDCLADSYRNKYSISLKDVQVNGFFVGELNFIPYILLHRAHEQYLLRFGVAVLCGNKQVTTFEPTRPPSMEN